MGDHHPIDFRAICALTGEAIDPAFPVADLHAVERACEAAEGAFDEYRALPSDRRAEFLDAIGDTIMALGEPLLARAHLESGLPLTRLTVERARTVNQLRLFADLVRSERWRRVRIDPAQPERAPLPRPDLRMRMIPLGPVAVFGASNFPLAFSTAGGDTASALAAGCPVVVKGHPAHPGTDAMVAEAIREAAASTGMPEGVFGHVMGPGNALGEALVRDPRIAAVGFTGSRGGGLALVRHAQARAVPIPVYAEMSSINPVILMPGALEERAEALAQGFVASLTQGAGQFCTNPGLVLGISGPALDRFEAAAAEGLAVQPAQAMLTPGISEAFTAGKTRLARADGVAVVAEGLAGEGAACNSAQLFAMTGADVLATPHLLEEVFGAASIIVRCAGLEELRQVIAGLEGQLTATLQLAPGDYSDAAALLPLLECKAGRVLVNGWPTGVEVSHAIVHGGPFPATSDARTTSVGTLAIERFLRPVCYQDVPEQILPPELQDSASVPKLLDGESA